MLNPEILQQLGNYAIQAKRNILANHPQFVGVLESAWQSIQQSVYQNIDIMFAQQSGTVTQDAIMQQFHGALYDRCMVMLNQQMAYQPAYNQQQLVPNYLGGGMATLPMPPMPTNIYAGSGPSPSTSVGGTVMSPAVLNASNIAAKSLPTMMPQQPAQTQQVITPTAVQPVQAQQAAPVQPQPVEQKPQFQTYTVDEEPPSVELTEEEKLIEELSMLSPKECQKTTELVLQNDLDKITKALFNVKDVDAATLYTGVIASKGFRCVESMHRHFMDNVIDSVPDPMYANIDYTRLVPIKAPNTEGLKCFKAMKTIVEDEITSVKDKLIKIKDVIDNTVKVAGDEIDSLITGLVNKYTANGYLDYDGGFSHVEFDNIIDIIMVLGSSKPSRHTALWSNKAIKGKLAVVVGMILNKLKNVKVYNYENIGDVPFIMDCIGSYTTDENITLRTIEGLLLNRRSKDADKNALQSSPCYGELKKYTVIGLPSTAIITNCDLEIMRCACDDDAVTIIPMVLDPAHTSSLFEYFLINFSANTLAADVIIAYTPFVTVKYGMYVDEQLVRLVI